MIAIHAGVGAALQVDDLGYHWQSVSKFSFESTASVWAQLEANQSLIFGFHWQWEMRSHVLLWFTTLIMIELVWIERQLIDANIRATKLSKNSLHHLWTKNPFY